MSQIDTFTRHISYFLQKVRNLFLYLQAFFWKLFTSTPPPNGLIETFLTKLYLFMWHKKKTDFQFLDSIWTVFCLAKWNSNKSLYSLLRKENTNQKSYLFGPFYVVFQMVVLIIYCNVSFIYYLVELNIMEKFVESS